MKDASLTKAMLQPELAVGRFQRYEGLCELGLSVNLSATVRDESPPFPISAQGRRSAMALDCGDRIGGPPTMACSI